MGTIVCPSFNLKSIKFSCWESQESGFHFEARSLDQSHVLSVLQHYLGKTLNPNIRRLKFPTASVMVDCLAVVAVLTPQPYGPDTSPVASNDPFKFKPQSDWQTCLQAALRKLTVEAVTRVSKAITFQRLLQTWPRDSACYLPTISKYMWSVSHSPLHICYLFKCD